MIARRLNPAAQVPSTRQRRSTGVAKLAGTGQRGSAWLASGPSEPVATVIVENPGRVIGTPAHSGLEAGGHCPPAPAAAHRRLTPILARQPFAEIAVPLQRLDHCLVIAEDLEATRAFYTDALGLTVGPRPPFRFAGYWLYAGDVAVVHLADRQRAGAATADGGTGPLDHVAFAATGLAETIERLRANGV